ncbi:epigen [Pseudochaenichthys georgianus]|uniref:epigen n=1 Tax=Pseudochaenichthys georgianus TaxID=52239 RepID=UPI00146E552E|nr:pro-neuregulin-4, membrane-bound isoform [Pseudochaenichthys georgianus]
MVTQRQKYLENALLSAVAVLLLATAGRCEMLTVTVETTATPATLNSSPTTQLPNSSMEKPPVSHSSQRPCQSQDENYCANGGVCMLPQDSDKPSCICKFSYTGQRCLFVISPSHTLPELEKVIAISFGAILIIFVLAIIFCCFAHKRCRKSAPLLKSAPSESSV